MSVRTIPQRSKIRKNSANNIDFTEKKIIFQNNYFFSREIEILLSESHTADISPKF